MDSQSFQRRRQQQANHGTPVQPRPAAGGLPRASIYLPAIPTRQWQWRSGASLPVWQQFTASGALVAITIARACWGSLGARQPDGVQCNPITSSRRYEMTLPRSEPFFATPAHVVYYAPSPDVTFEPHRSSGSFSRQPQK